MSSIKLWGNTLLFKLHAMGSALFQVVGSSYGKH
jgi:hypothetical protein